MQRTRNVKKYIGQVGIFYLSLGGVLTLLAPTPLV